MRFRWTRMPPDSGSPFAVPALLVESNNNQRHDCPPRVARPVLCLRVTGEVALTVGGSLPSSVLFAPATTALTKNVVAAFWQSGGNFFPAPTTVWTVRFLRDG
jgi:hypothetical protein